MSQLRLYNTLEREKQEFTPINPDHVRIYACGPTVYNYAHIGNARMAVVFDVLVRVLKTLYPKVTYVSNITDVDDKIIEAANQTGEEIDHITRKFTDIYNSDMAYLGAGQPDIQPRATEHIEDMIDMTRILIEQGHAYEEQGHVMFNVPSYKNYGVLSGRSRDEQIAGARVEVAPYKKDPADFILWKPSTDDQPGWDSPFGRGRPGWHLECSVMAEKHLGLPFDIHGGGADLKFPHHENEIAQSCCAHGHEDDPSSFAKYWVHNGFLTVEGEKMSKSLGNVVLVHDLIDKKVRGEVIRLTLLSAHYRQPLDWTDNAVRNSRAQLDRFYQALNDIPAADPAEEIDIPESVMNALCDDLNTPRAMAALNDLCQKANSSKDPALRNQLLKAGNLLGILNEDPAVWLGYGETGANGPDKEEIDALVQERQDARKSRDFGRADEIRDQLQELGIVIEDTPQGPKWRKIS